MEELVFYDLETGGLDHLYSPILEIAAIRVADTTKLEIIDKFHIFVGLPEWKEGNLSPWAKEHHEKSGLLAACRATTLSIAEASLELAKWLNPHTIICGHSIHFDLMFTKLQMWSAYEKLGHRIFDYGQFARLMRKLRNPVPPIPEMPHRAMEDCLIELEEARNVQKVLGRLTDQP